MTDDPAARDEAESFGAYLTGRTLAALFIDRYVVAIAVRGIEADRRDQRLLRFMRRHPWSIGFIDGGLALRRPGSAVRDRLLVMSAIIEATPDYAPDFLPTGRSPLYAVYIAFVGLRAGVRGIIGSVLISVV
jgi:hypothetical protein